MKDIIQKLAEQSESFYLYDEGGIKAQIRMPVLRAGDIVVVDHAGAYAAALSPMQFSTHTPPDEYLLREDGRIEKYACRLTFSEPA